MAEGCKARVPDHTDFVNCGDVVLRGGFCARHLYVEVLGLREKERVLVDELAIVRAALNDLQTESG